MSDSHPYPDDRLYHPRHLWLQRMDSDQALIGVSFYAQDSLGEAVHVDLPRMGEALLAGQPFGSIESHKAVSDFIAPVGGKVIEINPRLRGEPRLVNQSPYLDGWLLRIQIDPQASESAQLMDAAGYIAHLGL